MPRTVRVAPGGVIFHVLNRANARSRIFEKDFDYQTFMRVSDWVSYVNQALTLKELEELRLSAQKGRSFGSESWKTGTAQQLSLQSTMRARGRPRREK